MEVFKLYKPSTGYPMSDFTQSVMEILLNVHDDLQGFDRAQECLFNVYEKAAPNITEKDAADFIRIAAAFRCIQTLVSKNENAFGLLVSEQHEYQTIFPCTEIITI